MSEKIDQENKAGVNAHKENPSQNFGQKPFGIQGFGIQGFGQQGFGKKGFGLGSTPPPAVAQRKTPPKPSHFLATPTPEEASAQPIQKKENNTGLPDSLKSGIENLSGQSMDDVKVHRNSDQPSQMQAHAFAQGTDIHLGPGQEKHLPHEAWHVVQQKEGRVKPTMQMKGGVNVNDNPGLEREADVMGAKAYTPNSADQLVSIENQFQNRPSAVAQTPVQRVNKDRQSTAEMDAAVSQNGLESTQLADNRPESVAQRKFIKLATKDGLNQPSPNMENGSNDDTVQRVVRVGNKKIKSAKTIRQLWRADELDEHFDISDAEKMEFQGDLLRLAEAGNTFEFADWTEAQRYLIGPKVIVTGSDKVVTVIRNTTDLLVWLGSYPLPSEYGVNDYADSATLSATLDLLIGRKKAIKESRVWRTVFAAKQGATPTDDPNVDWGEMEMGGSYDLLGQTQPDSVPARFRRKIPQEIYQEQMAQLAASLDGYKLVGLHATTMENTGALVKEGISSDMFGTGHGLGKGSGFYIIPKAPQKQIQTVLKSAKGWGSHVVAIFLPNDAEQEWAEDGENVQTLEQAKDPENKRYYIFGEGEAVIPPSLCDQTKIIVDPADISMGNTEYEAEKVDNNTELNFLADL